MVNYSGSQVFPLAGQESTFNTPVSTTKDIGVIGTLNPELNNNVIDVRGLGDREAAALIAGNFDGSLSIDGPMTSGALLEMFFGQSTDTQTTGDYKHTFVNHDGSETILSVLKSYTISENFDSTSDITFTYGGCSVNTVDISIALNDVVQVSSEIFAADVDTGTTAGTKVLNTTTPLSFSQCSLSTGNEDSESTMSQVTQFDISFNNNFDYNDIRGIGSRLALGALPKNLEVTGSFTVKFNSKTESERFLGGTTSTSSTPTNTGMIFQATNGVTLGSGRIELYIRLGEVQYESVGRTSVVDGVSEEVFNFRAAQIKDVFFVDAVSTYY